MGQPASLFIDQAAALLGVSRRTVYYLIREGALQTIRTRCGSQRVVVDSLQEQLRQQVLRKGRRRYRRRAARAPAQDDSEAESLSL